jgi:hypothetical protein
MSYTYIYIYIPVLQESSKDIIPTGVIGGLVGAIGILIIVIVGLLYSRKSGKFLNTNQSINQSIKVNCYIQIGVISVHVC